MNEACGPTVETAPIGERLDHTAGETPTEPAPPPSDAPDALDDVATYDRAFFWGYTANALVTMTNALLSRYVEFVRLHDPVQTEWRLGVIIGCGMIGALLMRMFLGGAIDRYGAGRMWKWCGLAAFLTCFAHLLLARVDDHWVYVVRIAYQTSLAGVFGASIVYVSQRCSPEKMAEVIGTLGTGGFLGMLAGPVLGDVIFSLDLSPAARVQAMFLAASTLALVAWFCTFGAIRGEVRPPAPATDSVLGLLRKHQPGAIMLVGVLFGVALVLIFSFFADFAKKSGLGVGLFFTVYALSAFAARLATRRFPERYGIAPMIYVGLTALSAGYLTLPFVAQTWQLIAPAMLGGIAHAFVFPAVVAGGSAKFPQRSRGVATALMLLTLDVGMAVGSPVVGATLDYAKRVGWPPYTTVYVGTALLGLAVMGVYAWSQQTAEKPAVKPVSA